MVNRKEQELDDRTAKTANEAEVTAETESEEGAFEPEETQLTSSRKKDQAKRDVAWAGF